MNLVLATLKKILFWSYDRGTWQYDVMCVLILAFIFLSPNGLFKIKNSKLRSDTWVSAKIPVQTTQRSDVASLPDYGRPLISDARQAIPAKPAKPNRKTGK